MVMPPLPKPGNIRVTDAAMFGDAPDVARWRGLPELQRQMREACTHRRVGKRLVESDEGGSLAVSGNPNHDKMLKSLKCRNIHSSEMRRWRDTGPCTGWEQEKGQ